MSIHDPRLAALLSPRPPNGERLGERLSSAEQRAAAALLAERLAADRALLDQSSQRPLAAVLLGPRTVSPDGLAALLASHQPKPPAPPPDEAPAIDMGALLDEARAEGHAAGLVEGEARGRAGAMAELAPRLAALTAAAAAFQQATAVDEAALAPLLTELARAICEAVLMAELARPRSLLPLVQAALAEVAEAAMPTLSAHPDTLALIAADLPPGLVSKADASLPPGHVAVQAAELRVDAGLADRLSRLLKGLG